MKRRQFIQSVGASAAMATMPAQAFAIAATPRTYGMDPYKFAKYTARVNKKLTPDMLRNLLGFSEDAAQRMMKRLMSENVLMAPDASGLCQTHTDYISGFKDKYKAFNTAMDKIDEILDDIDDVAPESTTET